MKKYQILLVVRWPIGGIRTFFRYFYRYFDERKYHFTLIAPAFSEVNTLLEDLSGLDLKYIPLDKRVSNRQFFLKVTKVIIREKFNLVHSHGYIAGLSSTVGSLLANIPHILTTHDVFIENQFTGIKGFFKRIIFSAMFATLDSIHCVTYDVRNNLLDFLPFQNIFKDKLIIIPHGIDVGQFLTPEKRDLKTEYGLSENCFLIGFLGRFMPQKGFVYLVDALQKLIQLNKLPLKPFIICIGSGGGYIREEKDAIKKKKVESYFLFLPYVENVSSTLKGLDVIVMPSLWEACGLLAMEAMVAGVPLIGTNCIGLREVLKNTPAVVVPPKDSLALSEALVKEMTNTSKVRAREFSGEAAVRFDVRKQAVELEKLMLKYLE